jgi:predicted ATP-dependent endonuclease of OLD family
MKIQFIDIQNFRKLECIHMTFADETTLLVGANNSGKTSAMHALIYFLHDHKSFRVTDFTASNWEKINAIGEVWENEKANKSELDTAEEVWDEVLPALDVWLNVNTNEIHRVRHIIPSLEWAGGLLGVRLRYEPLNYSKLKTAYLAQRSAAIKTMEAAAQIETGKEFEVQLWPTNLQEYLTRTLGKHFKIQSYTLNPYILSENPQDLPLGSEPLDAFPLDGIVRVDLVPAQRGFSNTARSARKGSSTENTSNPTPTGSLTSQLRGYYDQHLDPTELSEPSDVDALQAIHQAQAFFDKKLQDGFSVPFKEVEGLGYPGFTDPKITISTQIEPMDGLNHESAVQFEISSSEKDSGVLRLPEHSNGLGYQNLIYIIFKLMMFRASWMRVGKAGKRVDSDKPRDLFIPPLHLVLVEEPEAHLHAQVQQVFIEKAYNVLRQHKDLLDGSKLTTQLIVSTHSSHIAHKQAFSSMRYFRRLPESENSKIPTSSVIDLATTFTSVENETEETERFVSRYIEATHCDLFFADAAILIEGAGERMLLPHFIKKDEFKNLSRGYITTLEIGGSHAHRFRPLIEKLGLTTLVITDIDAMKRGVDGKKPTKVMPELNKSLITGNTTLSGWIPKNSDFDQLSSLKEADKVKQYDLGYSVRVAYQCPTNVDYNGEDQMLIPSTFEDALALENIDFFKGSAGNALIKKFRAAVNDMPSHQQLSQALFDAVKKGGKGDFALNLLYELEFDQLEVPSYIADGLTWLQNEIAPQQTKS